MSSFTPWNEDYDLLFGLMTASAPMFRIKHNEPISPQPQKEFLIKQTLSRQYVVRSQTNPPLGQLQ